MRTDAKAIAIALDHDPQVLGIGVARGVGDDFLRASQENVGALEVQLSAEDLARIDAIAPRGVASGLRYAEGGMATVNR